MTLRRLLLGYALLQAVLYSALLPLWEGFDEPFHYANLQSLRAGRWPDPREARLSAEIAASLELAPASHVVRQNLPQVTTYAAYLALPAEERAARRARLYSLDPALAGVASAHGNYEAHHAPLAYLLLTPFDLALSRLPLPWRVLLLRGVCAVSGGLLLATGSLALGAALGLDRRRAGAAAFTLLSLQMTWATLAHIANDWLALPLTVWLLVFLLRGQRRAAALTLTAGLLTKAYFLAFLPCLLFTGREGLAVLGAAPWYLRNLVLFSSLTGMQESRAGIGLLRIGAAFPSLPWGTILPATLHAAVWTGNNTMNTLSRGTVNLFLVLVAAGVGAVLWRRPAGAERGALAWCALYLAALTYSTGMSYLYTGGAAAGPSPWYVQPLWPPLLALAIRGWPRVLGILLPLAAVYLDLVTYFVKLLPLYGGFEGSGRPGTIIALFVQHFTEWRAAWEAIGLVPAPVILALAAATVAYAVVIALLLVTSASPDNPSESLPSAGDG